MKFIELFSEMYDNGRVQEITSYVRPSKKYKCPICGRVKRKLVNEFQYYSYAKEVLQTVKFPELPCDDCFSWECKGKILNEYYGVDYY